MDRHYIINSEPKLISLVVLIESMVKNGVLECEQSELERIIRLDVDKIINIQEVQIKRVI